MIQLKDVRDYLKLSNLAESYYVGHLDNKKELSIGVYQLNKNNAFERAIGNISNDKVKTKSISVLIHWNKNAVETEEAALNIYNYIKDTQPDTEMGENVISYVDMLYNEPIDVGTDEQKIYERVIEFIIYYAEKKTV